MNNQEKQKRLKEKEQIAFMDEVDAALHRRPRIGARGLSLGTAVAVILFLIWANHSEIDEVSRGQGQVISSQHTQVIENLEGGILQEMLVYEGQIVDKGTPLARLSNETAESLYRDALGKSRETPSPSSGSGLNLRIMSRYSRQIWPPHPLKSLRISCFFTLRGKNSARLSWKCSTPNTSSARRRSRKRKTASSRPNASWGLLCSRWA